MRYTSPVAYKNTILDEYIPERNMTTEDVCSHVSDLIPFLELNDDAFIEDCGFRLHKVHDLERNKPKKAPRTSISDEAFRSLMPSRFTSHKTGGTE